MRLEGEVSVSPVRLYAWPCWRAKPVGSQRILASEKLPLLMHAPKLIYIKKCQAANDAEQKMSLKASSMFLSVNIINLKPYLLLPHHALGCHNETGRREISSPLMACHAMP